MVKDGEGWHSSVHVVAKRHDLADNKAIDQEAKKKKKEAKLKGSRVLVLFRKQQKYYFTLDFNKTRMLSAPKNSEKL